MKNGKFEIGDLVMRISVHHLCSMRNGDRSVVTNTDLENHVLLEDYLGWHNCKNLKLIRNVRDTSCLKTEPWYISANTQEKVAAAEKWLYEKGIFRFGGETLLLPTSAYLTNRMLDRQIDGFIMVPYGDSITSLIAKEIKLTYGTAVTGVEYPCTQTPEQKEAERIRKELEKLSHRLKELEG